MKTKKIIAAAVAAVCVASASLCGCVSLTGVDARDGKDGGDVSIHAIYEATNAERKAEGLEELTFLDFVSQYLSYSGEELKEASSLQASINRSLLSGVSIAAGFNEAVNTNPFPGWGWSGGTTTQTNWYFGSGAIIDLDREKGDAYVVTNCHVIYNDTAVDSKISKRVYLFLYGMDAEYDVENCAISATVVGASRSYDIALLKVEGSEILKKSSARAARFVKNDDVNVGETVYAIGNPEGGGLSATQGIISKESETISVDLSSSKYNQIVKNYRVLRTDAAINSGNSGGGLFNLSGELVGIVNAKASSSEIDNMGYALPSSNVRRLIALMKEQEVAFDGSGTGVKLPKIEAAYAAKECVSKFHDSENRVEIVENVYVTEAGGGLEVNDSVRHIKITDEKGGAVEDKAVSRLYHFTDTLLSARKGYTVTVTVSRGGEEIDVTVPVTFASTD